MPPDHSIGIVFAFFVPTVSIQLNWRAVR